MLCYFFFVDKKETELTDFGYSRQYKKVRISVKEGALEKEQVSRKIYMYSAILKKIIPLNVYVFEKISF